MAILRKLNAAGQSRFKAWIENGAHGDAPSDLLDDPETSEAVDREITIDEREFENRLEFGEYLVEQLEPLPAMTIRFDSGLWDWLALFYIDQLLPVDGAGNRKRREIVRYVLELKNRKWSRHLVRMSWMGVKDHGDVARVMLTVPLTTHTDVIEQLAGQQEAFGAHSVVRLADRLYWDDAGGKLKTGTQGKKGGVPRRLVRFLRQLRRTFDPPAMSVDQLLTTLPREFDRWHKPKKASTKLEAAEASVSA